MTALTGNIRRAGGPAAPMRAALAAARALVPVAAAPAAPARPSLEVSGAGTESAPQRRGGRAPPAAPASAPRPAPAAVPPTVDLYDEDIPF